MREVLLSVPVESQWARFKFVQYDRSDLPAVKAVVESISSGNVARLALGLRREAVKELSEILHCVLNPSVRYQAVVKNPGRSSASFDTYCLRRLRREQIKSTIIDDDCTSFGPDSKEDVIWFYDFYNDGVLDGTHTLWRIDGEMIARLHNVVLCAKKGETFEDQARQGRRPRLSLKKFLWENGISPEYEGRAI